MSDVLSNVDPNSIAIGQKLVMDYFQTLMGSRDDILSYYGHDAVLNWNGDESIGHEEIQNFLFDLAPTITFQITGFEVQTVPDTDLWTMLVVYGSYQPPNDKMRDFHSSFFVEARTEDQTAFIRYHTFSSF